MKKIYLEPTVEPAIYGQDVILSSIATEGEKDPYINDKDWGALL